MEQPLTSSLRALLLPSEITSLTALLLRDSFGSIRTDRVFYTGDLSSKLFPLFINVSRLPTAIGGDPSSPPT